MRGTVSCDDCHAQQDLWDDLGRCGATKIRSPLPVVVGEPLERCPVAGALDMPEVIQLEALVDVGPRQVLTDEGEILILSAKRGDLTCDDWQLPPRLRCVIRMARAWRDVSERRAAPFK